MLDCGHEPSPHGPHTTGTAHTSDGKEICWDCADKRQREDMKTAKSFVAYVTSDGTQITTWSGGLLAHVEASWERRVGFGGTRTYLRVKDVHGHYWHGTSPGSGMYCRLRRSAC